MKTHILIFLTLITYAYCSAQVKIQTAPDSTIEAYIKAASQSTVSTSDNPNVDSEVLQKAFEKQELQHRIAADAYNQRVYEWQLFNSKIIFWLVVLLVLSGVTLSGFQFYKDHIAQVKFHELTDKMTRATDSGQPQNKNDSMTIEASLQGLKFNSNIIGMMILIISFLFFFAYLKFVYPIQ